jgi:hypothetical protein
MAAAEIAATTGRLDDAGGDAMLARKWWTAKLRPAR